jgi:hypothetical protein
MRRNSAARIAVTGLVLLAAVGCDSPVGPNMESSSEYASRDAALASGGVAKGWLPPFLPASARRIREVHNLDSNQVRVWFDYAEHDAATMLASCRRVDLVALREQPAAFRRDDSRRTTPVDVTDGYRCRTSGAGDWYLALDRHAGAAFCWRPSTPSPNLPELMRADAPLTAARDALP